MRDQTLDSDEGKVALGEFNEKWLANADYKEEPHGHGHSDDEDGHHHHWVENSTETHTPRNLTNYRQKSECMGLSI